MDMICTFARDFHQTVILVSHDPEMASYAHHIVTLLDGKVVHEEYTRRKIYPMKEYARPFVPSPYPDTMDSFGMWRTQA